MQPHNRFPCELQIVEEPKVTDAVAEAHAQYSRFHDIYDGLTWRLARDSTPEEAREIAPEIFYVRTFPWPHEGFCIINLVYTVSDGQLFIEDMWVEPIPKAK